MATAAYRGGFSDKQRREIRWASRLARADGVVIGRLLDGHDLLTQLCANRAAASGPPIEVKLDD